jgi:hypothetical protein
MNLNEGHDVAAISAAGVFGLPPTDPRPEELSTRSRFSGVTEPRSTGGSRRVVETISFTACEPLFKFNAP